MEHEIAQLAQALRAQTEQNAKMMGMFGRMATANSSPADKRKMERDLFSQPASRFGKAIEGIQNSTYQYNRAMNGATRATEATSNSMKLLGQDAGAAKDALSGMAKTLLGGAIGGVIVGGLLDYVTGLTKTYQGLADVGHTFGGSIIGMTEAAARSEMTLDRYAKVIRENSELASQLGGKGGGLGQMLASVRTASMDAGMFGFTMEGLDSYATQYLETLRAQGRLEQLDHIQAARNIRNMAGETSAMAIAFGKSRDELTKMTAAVRTAPSYKARIAQMDKDSANMADEVMTRSLGILSGLPGDIGKLLSQSFGEMFGANGNVALVSTYQDTLKYLPGSAEALSKSMAIAEEGMRLKDPKLADKAAIALHNDLRESAKTMLPQAHIWAISTDSKLREVAAKIIDLATNEKDITEKSLAEAREQAAKQTEITKLMSNAEANWAKISSTLKLAFLPLIGSFLENFAKGVENFTKSKAFEELKGSLTRIGGFFQDWVASVTTPEKMAAFSTWVTEFLASFKDIGQNISGEEFKAFIGRIGGAIMNVVEFSVKLREIGVYVAMTLLPAITTLVNNLGTLAVAAVGLWTAFKGFQLYKMFKGLSSMTVSAGTVILNRKGGLPLDIGGGDGNGKGKGGRMRRAGRAVLKGAGALGAGAVGLLGFMDGPIGDWVKNIGGKISDSIFDGGKDAAKAAEDAAKGAGAAGKARAAGPEAPKTPEVPKATSAAAAEAKAAGGALEAAESKALRASKLLKGMGALGTLLSTIDGGMQVYDLNERSKQEGWDDNKFREELTKLLAPMLVGTAGALAGGALGAAGGSLIAPGIGSLIGGVGGAIGGSLGGDKLGEMIAPLIVDAIKKAPIAAVNTGEQFGPPIPPSLRSPGELDPAATTKKIEEIMSSIEEQKRVEAIASEKMLAELIKNNDLIRQQTEMQAQLLNRNNETVKITANDIRRATESNGN